MEVIILLFSQIKATCWHSWYFLPVGHNSGGRGKYPIPLLPLISLLWDNFEGNVIRIIIIQKIRKEWSCIIAWSILIDFHHWSGPSTTGHFPAAYIKIRLAISVLPSACNENGIKKTKVQIAEITKEYELGQKVLHAFLSFWGFYKSAYFHFRKW